MLRAPLCAFLCRHRRQPLRGSGRTQRPRLCPKHVSGSTRQHFRSVSSATFFAPNQKTGFIFGLRRKGMRGMWGGRGLPQHAAPKQNAASPALGLVMHQEITKMHATHTSNTQIDRPATTKTLSSCASKLVDGSWHWRWWAAVLGLPHRIF